MRIAFIIRSKDADTLEALRARIDALRSEGHEVEPRLTFEAGDASRFAAAAAADRADLVIAAGGDGTVNETVNGVHGWLARRGGGGLPPRLAIVPLGTANDLATALGVPTDPGDAVDAALHGNAHEVDVARVNNRCFLNVSTGGFGAEATDETSDEVKRALGPLAYVITGVRKFVALNTSPARFTAGEPLYAGPFLLFAVGNSRLTGGGNLLTPRARMDDGLLDVCIVKEMSRVEFLALLPDLRAGAHLDHPAIIYRQVPELTIQAEEELSVNADGEPLHERAFHYSISPHRLLLVQPR